MTVEEFLDLFRKALDRIDTSYYGLLLSSSDMLEYAPIGRTSLREILWNSDPRKGEIKDLLDRYDERVFCYELYHQVRASMDELNRQQPGSTDPFKFQGELRKDIVGKVALDYLKLKSLEGTFIPDFLLHSPGDGRYQGLIIEVKSARNISFNDLQGDLLKIERFIRYYKYQRGVSLVINNPASRVKVFLRDPNNQRWIKENLHNRSRILLMYKEHPGAELTEYNLGDLSSAWS